MANFFGLFNYNKPGKGVRKDEPAKTGAALFFDIFLLRFWKLIQLNLAYILCSLPAIGIVFFMSAFAVVWLTSFEFSVTTFSINEISAVYIASVCLTTIFIGIFGSGSASAGMAYVIRNYVNNTHAWVWSDFKDSMKENFLKGTLIFIIDVIVTMLFVVSIVFYSNAMTGLLAVVLRTVVLVVFAIFAVMHMYVYPLLAGFELKIKDIYRNAFFLTMAKLPWNVFSFILTALLGYAMIYIAINSILGLFAVICVFFSFFTFTQRFMVNNVIKKYLLEPALKQQGTEEQEQVEAVFDDNVTIDKSNLS